jgi:hypothetical protein
MIWVGSMAVVSSVLIVMTMSAPRRGLRWYLIAALVAPYFSLGSVSVRLEVGLAPILLVMVLVSENRAPPPPILPAWLSWWTWILVVTAFEAIIATQSAVVWLDVYTLLRPVFIVALFYVAGYSEREAVRIIRDFVLLAVPLALFALAQVSGNVLATSITVDHYNSRAAVPNLIASLGSIVRAVSTLELPANAATYFLMAIGGTVILLAERQSLEHGFRRWPLLVAGIAGLAGGFATGSATFIAGVIVLSLWVLYRSIAGKQGRLLLIGLVVALIGLGFGGLFLQGATYRARILQFQVGRVSSGSLLDTRYGSVSGNLAPTIQAIEQQPVTGYGLVPLPRVFLGDSLYVLLLYTGGVVGLLLFATVLVPVVRAARRTGVTGRVCLVWLAILLATGVATPTFFAPRIQDWWWALVGIVLSLARQRTGGDTMRDVAAPRLPMTVPVSYQSP